MPEIKSAAPFRRDSAIVLSGVTFLVSYNPFAQTIGDYRREQSLSDKSLENMTEEEFVAIVEFRATLLGRMVIEWDVTAFGKPVPPTPDAIMESLDAVFVNAMLEALREDMDPKEGGEPTPSEEPPASGEVSPPTGSTPKTPSRRSSRTATRPTSSGGAMTTS